MERYSEVIGLPVICVERGRKAGIVKDIVFCPGTREIKAFLLEGRSFEPGKKVVLLKDVLNVGKDAVIINDATCIQGLKKLEQKGELKDRGDINGLKVYCTTGTDLGVVKDVLFDCSTGTVDAVEVSDGLIQDIVHGRNILPFFGKVEFGQEYIVVGREALDEMTSNRRGIKKLIDEES